MQTHWIYMLHRSLKNKNPLLLFFSSRNFQDSDREDDDDVSDEVDDDIPDKDSDDESDDDKNSGTATQPRQRKIRRDDWIWNRQKNLEIRTLLKLVAVFRFCGVAAVLSFAISRHFNTGGWQLWIPKNSKKIII